ncbi:MAG TPA: PLP-dependent aminotransferase family protein [Streptosporangiaceae bacterium]|nr:PLP-dependent aminotransferase family protein [Streptosporangiaceae bacterium]
MSVLPASGVISFARGIPAPEMFPSDELAEAARLAFRRHSATALNYGPPAGFGPLREWLAEQHSAAPGQVVITPGSFVLLVLLARVLLRPSAPVLIEVPSYDRVNNLLRQSGAQIVPIRRGRDGLDFEALERYLLSGERPAFFYVMPTFHNPTGTTLSSAARQRLVDLAVRHDLLLIEDDPYGQLRFDGPAPPSLRTLLETRGAGRLSVFASSFSKVIAPGLRVGYGVLPEHLAPAVAAAALDTYVSPPLWPQAEIYEFLNAGFLPPQLSRIRELLRQRRDALVERLAAGLDGWTGDWWAPDGGYFLWLELPPGISAAALLSDAERAGVTFVPGSGFFADGGGDGSARLSFSFPAVADIRIGADLLVATARGHLVGNGAE